MLRNEARSLWQELSVGPDLADRHLGSDTTTVRLEDLRGGSSLDPEPAGLSGRSVLLAASDQLSAALAMIELDGIARRIVLCPSDLPPAHLASIVATAEVDAVVSDGLPLHHPARALPIVARCGTRIFPSGLRPRETRHTEWILLTSGTTGAPKLVVHDYASLAGPARTGAPSRGKPVWSTFYDIRRYGGLAILFRALLGGASMQLSSFRESTDAFLARAAARGVTHISGTPSHWRRALMSAALRGFTPQYVRLSGEIADQAILDRLRACFPEARIVHAFASTEAGFAFEVDDGQAGFPARLLDECSGRAALRVVGGSLQVRSPGAASHYLGPEHQQIAGVDGFVDTGDILEARGDRYHFAGRRDGIINVGGLKVHPEEVEAVLNAHPDIRMARVTARPNPFTGAVVMAEVVVDDTSGRDRAAIERELYAACRDSLARHKVPAAIRFVAALSVAPSGKLSRTDA